MTAWGLGVAVLVGAGGIWAALFSPQFQEWIKRRKEESVSISLGLAGAKAYEQPFPPGAAKAVEKTLSEIEATLPEDRMVWLHEKDFGCAFLWESIHFLEEFTWMPEVPARELLDRDLERLRLSLLAFAKEFLRLVALYTEDVNPQRDTGIHKIPAQYDEQNEYSDALFFKKAWEINDAAERIWTGYQELVRPSRWKLALSHTGEVEK